MTPQRLFLLGLGLICLLPSACGRRDAEPQVNPDEVLAAAVVEEAEKQLYGSSTVPPRIHSTDQGPAVDPIVIPECRLTVIDKQDVPSQLDGIILAIGREAEAAELVPENRRVVIRESERTRRFCRLCEDDLVDAGQLLAQLDDRKARDEYGIKDSKVAASVADFAAAEKTRDEAKGRYDRQLRLRTGTRATSEEEFRSAKLNWDRYFFEARSKAQGIKLAELERNQAKAVLDQHQIRSAIPGIIKAIHKKRGEAVKANEPLFQVYDLRRLRAEGLVDLEYRSRLAKGLRVVVEPTRPEGPTQSFVGHLQEITAVAVTRDSKLVVSGSEDGTVRVWDRLRRSEVRVLSHPGPVRAIACTPSSGEVNWCLTGASDGNARLWDLLTRNDQPLRKLVGGHKGAINCVAFSPDARWCATGGEDRAVCVWNAETGELCFRLPPGHRAAITALWFTPDSRLVTAARDHTIRVWQLNETRALGILTIDRRSGDVAAPGISPDGSCLLLDQGKTLRILSLPDKHTLGVLENMGEATPFTTFALFSPNGRLVLTAGAAEGRLQLWRMPTASTRAYELRQYLARERSAATCAAFAPDGTFLVTGTKDRQVLVWSVPTSAEVERPLGGHLTLVEQAVESSSRQAKVWAEVANPPDSALRLLPGTTVTLAIYPQ